MYSWKKGISLGFFAEEDISLEEMLRIVAAHGFQCVELSFSHDAYFGQYHLAEHDTARQLYAYSQELGLRIWSIHLPFSEVWDLSGEDAEAALQDDERLLVSPERRISLDALTDNINALLRGEVA